MRRIKNKIGVGTGLDEYYSDGDENASNKNHFNHTSTAVERPTFKHVTQSARDAGVVVSNSGENDPTSPNTISLPRPSAKRNPLNSPRPRPNTTPSFERRAGAYISPTLPHQHISTGYGRDEMLAQRKKQAEQLRWQQQEAETELRKQREEVEALKVQSKKLQQQHFDTKHQLLANISSQNRQDPPSVHPAAPPAVAYTQPTGLKLLWEGGYLWKIPFNSSQTPQRRWFQASQPSVSHSLRLEWKDPRNPIKSSTSRFIVLADVQEVRRGQSTAAFKRQMQIRGPDSLPSGTLCFSLITEERTVDLAATTQSDADAWISALTSVIFDTGAPPGEPVPAASLPETTISQSYRSPEEKDEDFWLRTLFPHVRSCQTREVSALFAGSCPVDLFEPHTGETALLIACRLGHEKIVELCLSWGAKNDPHPNFGQTGLQAAITGKHAGCARLLLETAALSQADSIIVNHEDHSATREAPLHTAAHQGDLASVELLLNHGADAELVDANGRTPLHRAARNGHGNCVGYLLDNGADVAIDRGDHQGNTPLHHSGLMGHTDVVKLLLETAANARATNTAGRTPHQLADTQGHIQCVQLLKQYEDPFLSPTAQVSTRCLKPGETPPVAPPQPAFVPRLFPKPRPEESGHAVHAHPGSQTERLGYGPKEQVPFTSMTSRRPAGIIAGGHAPSQAHGREIDADWAPTTAEPSNWPNWNNQEYATSTSVHEQYPGYHQHNDENHQGYNQHHYGQIYDQRACNNMFDNQYEYEPGQWEHDYPRQYQTHHQHESTFADDYEQSHLQYQKQNMEYRDGHAHNSDTSANAFYLEPQTGSIAESANTMTGEAAVKGHHWEILYTEEGHRYFFNNTTGHSQWEDPREQIGCTAESSEDNKFILASNEDAVKTYNGELEHKTSEEGDAFPRGEITNQREISGFPDDVEYGRQPQAENEHSLMADSTKEASTEESLADDDTSSQKETVQCIRSQLTVKQELKDQQTQRSESDSMKNNIHEASPSVLASQPRQQQHPALRQYFKMLTVGLPLGAVVQKMLMSGVTPDLVQIFQAQQGSEQQDVSPTAPTASSAGGGALHQMTKYQQYVKMKQIGVPLGSIRHKMITDGIREMDVDAFFDSLGGKTRTERIGPPRQGPSAATLQATARRNNNAPMMKLHWNSLSKDKISEKSIWASSRRSADSGGSVDLAAREMELLESVFCKSSAPVPVKCAPKKTKEASISLVDPRRANNVCISLAQFKEFDSYDILARAVVDLDDCILTLDKLQTLRTLLPTKAERKAVEGYEGAVDLLGPTEKFFKAICHVPHVASKLSVFIFKLQIVETKANLQQQINVVRRACHQITGCSRLEKVLHKMLAVGNKMNEGTYKGGAIGFTLSSLLKLTTTKGVDKKTTVLDIVIKMFGEQGNLELLDFPEELQDLTEASRYDGRQLALETQRLRRELATTNAELKFESDRKINVSLIEKLSSFSQQAEQHILALDTQKNKMESEINEMTEYLSATDLCSQEIFKILLQFIGALKQSKEAFLRQRRRRHK